MPVVLQWDWNGRGHPPCEGSLTMSWRAVGESSCGAAALMCTSFAVVYFCIQMQHALMHVNNKAVDSSKYHRTF